MFFVALDATSAMSFFIPAMEMVKIGEALCACCLSARARHKCPPIADFDDDNRVAQATAGVLSQKMPTCECFRHTGLMFSRTSQASRTPAISRFEMLTCPVLLVAETSCCLISSGHVMRHTVGLICLSPLIHTPPTPCLEASTYAMYHGVLPVSSRTDVGLDEIR
jgi:hypothetical protein